MCFHASSCNHSFMLIPYFLIGFRQMIDNTALTPPNYPSFLGDYWFFEVLEANLSAKFNCF